MNKLVKFFKSIFGGSVSNFDPIVIKTPWSDRCTEWDMKALEMLYEYVCTQKEDFTIEMARAAMPGLSKHVDIRRWGMITNRAIAIGLIVKTDRFAPAKSSNMSKKPLYRSGLN